ncbi:hypothetical protein [Humisphaera borealis]|uniref:Uncharacterized protein n=1 Tax=Humisphaera borealis TaxID=2807512 RepID=A0A7M2X1E7_9BACT|nr:hypothetical protein [Humisphaera borealis]QOV91494.1 hypothetical protein IPV69_09110 [Humisphaera borealis]
MPNPTKPSAKQDKRSADYDAALDPTVPDADLKIEQYLRRQSERAKAAMLGAADAMKSTAMAKVKTVMPGGGSGNGEAPANGGVGGTTGGFSATAPIQFVKKHPWYTVGAATAVGFLGASYLNPTRYGRLRGKLKSLEKRLAEQEKIARHPPVAGDSKAETAAKSSFLSSLGTLLLTQGLNIVKPIVTAYVEPLLAGRGHEQNGHDVSGQYAGVATGPTPTDDIPDDKAPPRAAGDPSI